MKAARYSVWALAVILVVAGALRLRFDVEILNLLPKELGVVEGLKLYQRYFSDANELIITVQAPTSEEAESASRALAGLLREQTHLVSRAIWQPIWMEHPDQASELIGYLWLNQPPGVFNSLTNRFFGTNVQQTLQEAQETLATSLSPKDIALGGYDPFGLLHLPEAMAGASQSSLTDERIFSSQTGEFRILFVEAKPDILGYRECRNWMKAIRDIVQREREQRGIKASVAIHYTGRPAFVTEIAGGMENDMGGSCGGTLATIGILFYLTHRRIRPLIWLLVMLLIILGGTMAFGGLIYSSINVVSMGFAAILAGLAEDFGVVVYQEMRSHPEYALPELRKIVAPGIFWSAITTAGAFLILNLSSLPGLAQLGTLIAVGILLAAGLMLYLYLPLLFRMRRPSDLKAHDEKSSERFLLFTTHGLVPKPVIWAVTFVILAVSAAVLWHTAPLFDHSPDVLKPRNSEAYATLERIKMQLVRAQEPLWVIVPGKNEREVAGLLRQVDEALHRAEKEGTIAGFTLPTPLWPDPDHLQANCQAAKAILDNAASIRSATLESGFTTNSLRLTDNIFAFWREACKETGTVYWPRQEANQWIFHRFVAHPPGQFMALGLIYPTADAKKTAAFTGQWPEALQKSGIVLSGWQLLGSTVFDLVIKELPLVITPIVVLVIVSLWLAFRNWREMVLSIVCVAYTGLCLLALMVLLGWKWNLLNLMAIPLLLGMGVDFGIHIQIALKRYGGDLLAVRRSVGRALLLAGSTTVVGFVSLAFSQNSGMASLGQVCALGILLAMIVSIYLLPVWWKAFRKAEGGRMKDESEA